MRRVRALWCRIVGHEWTDFDYRPWMDATGRWCPRCGIARSWTQLGLPTPDVAPSSTSPKPTSSLSLSEARTAWFIQWAKAHPPVIELPEGLRAEWDLDSVVRTSPSPKAKDTGSASARNGASR